MLKRFAIAAPAVVLTLTAALAQSPAQQQLERGIALWDQRLANSAIAALEKAAAGSEGPRGSGAALGAGGAAPRRRVCRRRVGRSGAAASGDQGARREAGGRGRHRRC